MIDALIDKQDTFEIVRDKIALILANETASQQSLAATAGEDSELWKLRIFTERSNPWEQFLNDDSDRSPIVNIWYADSNFPKGKGNTIDRQHSESVFNIDVVGYGKSRDDFGGHQSGDEQSALTVQRGVRLVRNILMSNQYTYLDLRGVVSNRWPQSITVFQPEQNVHAVQSMTGARISFRVEFNEFSPQNTQEVLESIGLELKRASDGQVLADLEYDYT